VPVGLFSPIRQPEDIAIVVIIAIPKEKTMRFKVILEKSDEGGYTAYVPSLPGCISEGETKEDALKNIQEAIELYLESVEDDWILDEKALVQEIEL
jgi:predicted RNase H-like HicB family nuclease